MTPNVSLISDAGELITLGEAKEFLRIDLDQNAEDLTIQNCLAAARRHAEDVTRRALTDQVLEATWDCWPILDGIWEVPRPPLQSVTSITWKDEDGLATTWASTEYAVDAESEPGRIALLLNGSIPSNVLYPLASIRMQYKAGYLNLEEYSPATRLVLPAAIRRAILEATTRLYEHRGDDVDFQNQSATRRFLPPQFHWLLDRYRMKDF